MIRQGKIRNDGKTCNVMTQADIYGVTVHFDNSFTLRLNQDGLEDLIELLMNTSRDLDGEREDLDMSGEPFDQNGDLVIETSHELEEPRGGWAGDALTNDPDYYHPDDTDTLKARADEKEDYKHLLNLAQCSEV